MKFGKDLFSVVSKKITPERGVALISEPGLNDFYFKRSVILLTEHNEQGSAGFVLNKFLDFKLSELIEDFPAFNTQLILGGPVEKDSLHFIHTVGDAIPGAIHICDSIYWGGDFNTLRQLIDLGKIKDNQIKFFIGYAGWSSGQLNTEITQNTWVVIKLSEREIMNSTSDLWRTSVGKLGKNYQLWLNYPENPHMN